jgi:LytS/YehU family sensor histidine kinase
LQQELELLDCYISIEQTRFKDRLTIQKEIDSASLVCEVPTMILQPLVENAVRHGIAKHKQADRITIVAQRANGRLLLEVHNCIGSMENGSSQPARRIGLANTRARLEHFYNGRHSFEIANRADGGVVVKLNLPTTGDVTNTLASKAGKP